MPIIFISAYGDVPKSVQAMKAGALEFLTKPINDDALVNAIRNALQRSSQAQALNARGRNFVGVTPHLLPENGRCWRWSSLGC